MKTLLKTVLLTFILHPSLSAQDINWRAKDSPRHLVAAGFGADYNFYYNVSYGYLFRSGSIPAAVGTEFSLPFGSEIADDWKWRTSVQAELWHRGNLSLSVRPAFILRRHASPLARMYNVAADVTVLWGYLKPKWGIMALANYDGAIATHIKHRLLKESYPEITDGWYGKTGGNFKLGTRANLSVKSWNVYFTAGKHFGQNFKDNPTLPFFLELAVQCPLGK